MKQLPRTRRASSIRNCSERRPIRCAACMSSGAPTAPSCDRATASVGRIPDTPTGQDLASAAVDSSRNHWLAVGAAGTVIRSTDGARNWQQVATPGPAADLRVVLFDAASGAWLAAGSNGTLLRSVDGGVVWKASKLRTADEFQALAREPVSGACCWAARKPSSAVPPMAARPGASRRWRWREPLTPVTGFHSCGARLFARSALGRVLVSADHGASWRVAETRAARSSPMATATGSAARSC